MTRFDGRVALITGAGRGIGRAYAAHLSARGATVVVNNRVHPDKPSAAQAVVEAIVAKGGKAVADEHSIDSASGAQEMIETIYERLGRLDIIINNAAMLLPRTPFEETSLETQHAMMETNYWGSVYPLHAAMPRMKQAGYGRVVFTTSTAGCFGQAGTTAYAATKIAVVGLARSLARENADLDFRFNLISPFAVTNERVARLAPSHVQSMLTPEKIAPMVAWLCSEECTQNGMTFFAAAGRYKRHVMADGPRVDFEGEDLTAEVMKQIAAIPTLEAPKHSGVAGVKLVPEILEVERA